VDTPGPADSLDLDDLYEMIESSSDLYDDYQLLLQSIKEKDE